METTEIKDPYFANNLCKKGDRELIQKDNLPKKGLEDLKIIAHQWHIQERLH